MFTSVRGRPRSPCAPCASSSGFQHTLGCVRRGKVHSSPREGRRQHAFISNGVHACRELSLFGVFHVFDVITVLGPVKVQGCIQRLYLHFTGHLLYSTCTTGPSALSVCIYPCAQHATARGRVQ